MNDWLAQWGGWIAAGLLVVIGLIVLVWRATTGDRVGTARAAADMLEAWHKQDIATKQAKIDALRAEQIVEMTAVRQLEDALATKRAKLETNYVDKGLSAEEIADRFARLGL